MDTLCAVRLLIVGLAAIILASSSVSKETDDQSELVPQSATESEETLVQHDEAVITSIQEFRQSWLEDISADTKEATLTSRQKKWVSHLGKSNRRWIFFRTTASPALRKEYRQLTESERHKFHAALHAMNDNLIDGVSEYHIFVRLHAKKNAPAAHMGAGFLPWHREYLTRFEQALRKHDPSVSLPYWDSQLDSFLHEPRDSIIWSEGYMGDNKKNVTWGPFGNWSVPEECGYVLRRYVRPYFRYALINDRIINRISNFTTFEKLVVDRNFEWAHGGPHVFVGGQMANIQCSPSDPMFWMHHAFVDLLWEEFRQKSQSTDLETEYPIHSRSVFIGGTRHNPNSTMHPFGPLTNIDGIREKYTRDDYKYAPRAITCSSDADCGPSLWCHAKRCQTKVRFNGICNGFPVNSTEPCERGQCLLNKETYRCMTF